MEIEIFSKDGLWYEFEAKVAIAVSDDVPAVLGRFEALDLFRLAAQQ